MSLNSNFVWGLHPTMLKATLSSLLGDHSWQSLNNYVVLEFKAGPPTCKIFARPIELSIGHKIRF